MTLRYSFRVSQGDYFHRVSSAPGVERARIFPGLQPETFCHTRCMTKILLVDDHAIVREGFKRLIERDGALRVAGEAASRLEALALLERIVLDLLSSPFKGARQHSCAGRGCSPANASSSSTLI